MNHEIVVPSHETAIDAPRDHHVCPWWVGYVLASPLRRLIEPPEKILAPHAGPGMTVVDLGSAMGYFSLPLARLVGSGGRVVCLDVQQRMLDGLVRRARRKGLAPPIEPRLCSQDGPGIEDLGGSVGLIVAFHMMHETARPIRVIRECRDALRPGGRFLVAEPRGHVSGGEWRDTVAMFLESGLVQMDEPRVRKSHAAVFEKA